MEQAGNSQGAWDGNRKRVMPEQLVPPLSKCMGTGMSHNDDDLTGEIESDYFVANWVQKVNPSKGKSTHNAGERVIYPTTTFVGVNPSYANPYKASFFLSQFCFETPNLRIRRSVFQPPNSPVIHHYVYFVRMTGKDQHQIVRLNYEDIQGLEIALREIRKEVEAYNC